MASVAEVDLVISTEDTLSDLERDLERIIRTAENGAPELDVEASLAVQESLTNLRQELTQVIRAAEESGDEIQIEAALDRDRSLSEIQESLRNIVRAAETGQDLTIQLEAEAPVLANLGQVERDVRAIVEAAEAAAPPIEVEVDVDRDGAAARTTLNLTKSFGVLTKSLGGLVGGMAATSVAASSLTSVLAGLVGAVQAIAPAAALATTGLLSVQLATNTVKLAMVGVKEAIDVAFDPEAKPEDLAKAMEKLAPEARSFVTELRGMKGVFKELQQDVQGNFFQGFDKALEDLSVKVLPQVSGALRDTSKTLNQMALGAAAAAVELGENGTLQKALGGATKGLDNLKEIPGQAVTAFGQLAAAAAPAFDRVTQAAATSFGRVTDKLAAAFESGALESAIDGAVDAIAQLGRIAGNVFGGLGNIIGAATSSGEGLFSTLEKVTQAFENVTASEGFQQALKALIETGTVIVDTVLPLITTALEALGPVFQALAGPVQILVRALGDGLGRVITALEPVLVSVGNAFGQLVIAVTPLIELAADLLVAVLPGLIPIFESLGQTLNALVPFIETLASSLSTALVPLFERIATEVLPQVLPPFVELTTKIIPLLTDVIIKLTPSLITLAETFGELLIALTPLIVELINVGLALAEDLGPAIEPVLNLILKLVNFGLKFLADTVTGIIIPMINILVSLLRGDFSAAWDQAGELIGKVVRKAQQIIEKFGSEAARILGELVKAARDKLFEFGTNFGDQITRAGTLAREAALKIPGIILNALGDLGNLLRNAGADIIKGLIGGISSQLGRLRDIASEAASIVSGSVKDFLGISSPSKLMREHGRDTMEGYELGIEDRMPNLRSQLQGVAALAPSFALPNGQTLQLPQVGNQGPVVQVFIGNEQLNGHFDARIARNNQNRDRLAITGVRR